MIGPSQNLVVVSRPTVLVELEQALETANSPDRDDGLAELVQRLHPAGLGINREAGDDKGQRYFSDNSHSFFRHDWFTLRIRLRVCTIFRILSWMKEGFNFPIFGLPTAVLEVFFF